MDCDFCFTISSPFNDLVGEAGLGNDKSRSLST